MTRKKALSPQRRVLALVSVGICILAALFAAPVFILRKPAPVRFENDLARIDASQLADGVFSAAWLGETGVRVRLGVQKAGGTQYLYELDPGGRADMFALTEGDGDYTVTFYRHVEDKRYQPAFSHTLTLALDDPLRPFLRPSRMVAYDQSPSVSALARALTADQTDAQAQFDVILDYVISHYTYDRAWANTVDGRYTPVLEDIIKNGSGHCLDLAVLTGSLLRVQGIPCKIAVGWAGDVYHAWLNVFIDGTWVHCDPTFLIGGAEEYANSPNHYLPLFFY